MHWTFNNESETIFTNSLMHNSYRNRVRTEMTVMKYLIWAQRRRAARTCRGGERWRPGWWLLCESAGWVWWERMHSRCCTGRPCASGSHRADLEEHSNTHTHWLMSVIKDRGNQAGRKSKYRIVLFSNHTYKGLPFQVILGLYYN